MPRSTAGTSSSRPARRSSSAGRPTERPSGRATSGASRSSGSRPASSTTRRCSRSTAATPTTCRRRSPISSKLLAKLHANAPSSVPIINLGNKDGYEALHAFGMVQGAYVTRPVHAQLDLPRPRQRLRSGCQRQGADDVPEVVQGRLLRQRLQRARREDRLGRVRQGHGRLLPRRQLAGRGHPERPQGATPGS